MNTFAVVTIVALCATGKDLHNLEKFQTRKRDEKCSLPGSYADTIKCKDAAADSAEADGIDCATGFCMVKTVYSDNTCEYIW